MTSDASAHACRVEQGGHGGGDEPGLRFGFGARTGARAVEDQDPLPGEQVRVDRPARFLVAARSRTPGSRCPSTSSTGEKGRSRPSDREADRRLLPAADFTQVAGAGHFIALERPDVLAGLLDAVA